MRYVIDGWKRWHRAHFIAADFDPGWPTTYCGLPISPKKWMVVETKGQQRLCINCEEKNAKANK